MKALKKDKGWAVMRNAPVHRAMAGASEIWIHDSIVEGNLLD
jgi:hypothetical protein